LNNSQRGDPHHQFPFIVDCMEMGRERADEEHPDDDAVKFRDNRHKINSNSKANPGKVSRCQRQQFALRQTVCQLLNFGILVFGSSVFW